MQRPVTAGILFSDLMVRYACARKNSGPAQLADLANCNIMCLKGDLAIDYSGRCLPCPRIGQVRYLLRHTIPNDVNDRHVITSPHLPPCHNEKALATLLCMIMSRRIIFTDC